MKKHLFYFISLFTLLQVGSAAASESMYKCTSSNGVIVFQGQPCANEKSDANKVDLKALEKRYPSVSRETNTYAQKNLIKNGDFSSGLGHWQLEDTSKTKSNNNVWVNAGTLNIQSLVPKKSRSIQQITLSQCVPIGNASEVILSARFEQSPASVKLSANRINLYWMKHSDCPKGGEFGYYLQPKSVLGWQSLERKKLVPALHAKAAEIQIVQRPVNAEGKVAHWDDVSLFVTDVYKKPLTTTTASSKYTKPPGINYLENPSFNLGITGWKSTMNNIEWEERAIKTTIESKHKGYGIGAFSQCVNIGTNRYFELGGKVKVAQSRHKTSTRLRLSWYNGENCTGPSSAGYKHVDSTNEQRGWQLKSTFVEAPQAVQSASINTTIGIYGKGTGAVYWDDIFFKAIKHEEDMNN